jgi:hypothetical protein
LNERNEKLWLIEFESVVIPNADGKLEAHTANEEQARKQFYLNCKNSTLLSIRKIQESQLYAVVSS